MGPLNSLGQDAAAKTGVRPGFARDTIEPSFESSPHAILTADAGGVTRAANSRTEDLFGYSSPYSNPYSNVDLIGHPVKVPSPGVPAPGRFRNTFNQNSSGIMIKLEGRIAGPWAADFGRPWEEKAPAAVQKQLSLDLRETTFVDSGEIKILRATYSQTGANFLTGTLLTKYLAEEGSRNST
jgi:hypothetical protein